MCVDCESLEEFFNSYYKINKKNLSNYEIYEELIKMCNSNNKFFYVNEAGDNIIEFEMDIDDVTMYFHEVLHLKSKDFIMGG
jgi:hypothetical protein